jgi:small ligand-binding sensory domain FIST
MDLDGVPALDALKSDAGEIIARDLKRAAGYIHAAQPIPGADGSWDYAVVTLSGIDRRRGWIEIAGEVTEGDPLMFVHHQPDLARRNVRRMLSDLAHRLAGRPVRGGLYIAGTQRNGDPTEGAAGDLVLIEEALGSIPLIGFTTEGEIHRDRLHGYAGMLALFL